MIGPRAAKVIGPRAAKLIVSCAAKLIADEQPIGHPHGRNYANGFGVSADHGARVLPPPEPGILPENQRLQPPSASVFSVRPITTILLGDP